MALRERLVLALFKVAVWARDVLRRNANKAERIVADLEKTINRKR